MADYDSQFRFGTWQTIEYSRPRMNLAGTDEERAMEILDNPGWPWGLSLIVLTMAIHATAVVVLAFVGLRIRVRLETRVLKVWNLIAIVICVIGVIGLLLAVVHGMSAGFGQRRICGLALSTCPRTPCSIRSNSMSTRGASGLTLQRPWHLMGALEAVDGMLLFGVSTAFLFSVMQGYWSMLTAHATASKG